MHDQFPKVYCFIEAYEKNYIKSLDKNIAIIYRNYNKKININEIKKINNLCKKNGNKFFLSNNIEIALKLNLEGVYIPSFNKSLNIRFYSKNKKLKILGSAHNISEIRQKELQGVDCIFLSPIFLTKKKKQFLGIYKFNKLSKLTKKKIICLGGINQDNLKKIKLINAHGLASISLFKDNIKYIKY